MKRYIISLATLFIISSCNNEDILVGDSINSESSNLPVQVLQERDPSLPTDMSKKDLVTTRSTANVFINPNEYIGYSYTIGNSVMGDIDNVRMSIINLPKVKKDYPSYVSSHAVRSTFIMKDSYASLYNYKTTLETTNCIKSGFKLNLGLFSVGREQFLEEKFRNTTIDNNKTVLGELTIEVQQYKHILNVVDAAKNRIASEYLQPDFLENLYFSTIDAFIKNYGEFLVTDYYVGGRASVHYWGEEKEHRGATEREQRMSDNINASFSWKKASGSGECGFGKRYSSTTDTLQKMAKFLISIKTTGGSGNHAVDLAPMDINKINLDMTPWLNSIINDANTHTFTGLAKGGLSPISDFILEQNFKRRFMDTHLGNLSTAKLEIPSIEIARVYLRTTSGGENLNGVAPVIKTRHGDRIVLWDGSEHALSDAELRANNNNDTFTKKANAISSKYKKIFACAITANPNERLNSLSRVPLVLEYTDFDMSKMRKCTVSATGMMYFYDEAKGYALSVFNDPYILRSYGLEAWAKSVPNAELSMRVMGNFKIVGL